MNPEQNIIEQAWENRANLSPQSTESGIKAAVEKIIGRLDRGELRVAEKIGGEWITHQWLKKAVLLSFRLADNAIMNASSNDSARYFDKVPTKFADYSDADFRAGGFRVVPPAVAARR